MYFVYDTANIGQVTRYTRRSRESLFGCRSGWIPYLLREEAPASASEPFRWHFNVRDAMARHDRSGATLVIDLKPNEANNVSLYEVVEVWGHSEHGWTPIMMRLRGLFVDGSAEQVDPSKFDYNLADADDPIFSVMYLRGTVREGALLGPWTAPGPSSTNGVLLWPHVMAYFTTVATAAMADGGSDRG